ncbi:hypothetical protein K501DRAFT_232514 [Backusella circina FSU 941]|nr:hypothetical protein K501DRAFT_232514 [Backusella circina FSU 941]
MKRSLNEDITLDANNKLIAIISKEIGFQGIQASALNSFSNALETYLEKMLTSAHLFAELGNRAKPNIHDIARSLETAGIQTSTFEKYLKDTMNHKDIVAETNKYMKISESKKSTMEETPEFLPSENEDSDEDMDDTTDSASGLPSYVPPHLPTFPSKHSFRQTPIYIQRPDDPQRVRELNSEQSRTVEENLKKLMSAENQLLRQTGDQTIFESKIMMPIVNYEGFIQRRKRSKQSGTTLNVEVTEEPKKPETIPDTELQNEPM